MTVTKAAPKPDARRVFWADEDCERLNRSEFEAVRYMLGAISWAAHAKDSLQGRLECIPYGRQRMGLALGAMKALVDDIIGTVTVGQCKQLRNTMSDMDIRMVPKRTPMTQNVIIEASAAKSLIDIAMEKCHGCVEDGRTCRSCELYKIMEQITPLEDYDNGMLCPYSLAKWEE